MGYFGHRLCDAGGGLARSHLIVRTRLDAGILHQRPLLALTDVECQQALPKLIEDDPMPTYQYACTDTDCGTRFELVQTFTEPAASECPVCEHAVR